MTEVTAQDDPGAADGDAAGPGSGQGHGRRARRLPPPGPAAPHQPRHRREDTVLVPCGHTLAHVCPRALSGPGRCAPRSAGRAGTSRTNPTSAPTRPRRNSSCGSRSAPRPSSSATRPTAAGQDTTEFDELIARAGRGDHQGGHARQGRPGQAGAAAPVDPAPPGRPGAAPPQGQPAHRRQDLHRPGRQDLPALDVPHPDLPVLRPGRRPTAAPVDPATYDYDRAARDALHFAALVDRFIQNLRRCVGCDVQYFAAVEPQRRLAPHVHIAIRGTISRAELRQVVAATYHQVWWPATTEPSSTTATSCRSGTRPRRLPRPGHRGGAADLGRGARRHRRPRTSRWHVVRFGARSTPRASSPGPRTPPAASAT